MKDIVDDQLLAIMGAVYAGGVIDSNNGNVKKLDEIPHDSRVLNGVAGLKALMLSILVDVMGEMEDSKPFTVMPDRVISEPSIPAIQIAARNYLRQSAIDKLRKALK